jgi:uncharacterized membrane protein YgcG
MSNAYTQTRSGCAPTRYREVVLTVLRCKVPTVLRREVLTVLRRKAVLTVSLCFALLFVSSCQLARRASVTTASPTPTPSPILVTPRLPYPTRFVNDYANVFDAKTRVRLETLLTKLRDKSNIEFAVATVDTTNGESIFNYSLGVAREWGVGPKDTSQGGGMLLMLAIKDRNWHLQVSRALEKDLPNDVCKELGDQSEEWYKKGDYGAGVEKYVAALIKRLEERRNFKLNG